MNIIVNLGFEWLMWVLMIEVLKFVEGCVYVCVDGYCLDNDDLYVFVFEDYGVFFKLICGNVIWGFSCCFCEDLKNENLFYLGIEFFFWILFD